jgi:thiamine biosynthesis lipoprotein
MIRRCQPLLGTFVEIHLDGGSDTALQREAGKAFELIRGIQRNMGFHDAESDVTRLNRCAHIAPLRVHPWTWRVLEHASQLSAETGGAFDITVAPQLVQWGYLPRHNSSTPALQAGAWQQIELLPDCRVRFHQPLQIDLGGTAKGFAVDKAIDYLASRGIEQATVNAGGDLRMHGPPNQPVVIRDPAQPQAKHHATMMLRPALATSAAYFSRKRIGGARVSPIVHPRTGKPLRSNTSVSVFAPTCMEADALTKAVLLAPRSIWNALLKTRDSLALFLTSTGEPALYPA